MEWRENPQLAEELLAMVAAEQKLEKPLPHVAELIYCLTRSYKDRFSPMPATPKATAMMSVGVGLGEVLLKGLRQEVGGECEGIYYSADFLTIDDRLGELKTTRMSARKEPADFPPTWTKQLLAYMRVRETLDAAFVVFYVIPADMRAWSPVTATEGEVWKNWMWLQARRAVYLDFVDRHEVPTPFQHNEDWECRACQYKLECDAEQARARVEDSQGDEVLNQALGEQAQLESQDRAEAEESAQQETSH